MHRNILCELLLPCATRSLAMASLNFASQSSAVFLAWTSCFFKSWTSSSISLTSCKSSSSFLSIPGFPGPPSLLTPDLDFFIPTMEGDFQRPELDLRIFFFSPPNPFDIMDTSSSETRPSCDLSVLISASIVITWHFRSRFFFSTLALCSSSISSICLDDCNSSRRTSISSTNWSSSSGVSSGRGASPGGFEPSVRLTWRCIFRSPVKK